MKQVCRVSNNMKEKVKGTFLGNYLFYYGLFKEQQLKSYEHKFNSENERYQQDYSKIINNQKAYAKQDWSLIKNSDDSTSFLLRDFQFKGHESLLAFMNKIKPICDELDHHPEWGTDGNTLKIRLTSHFNQNKVSPMDYELAAMISREYSTLNNYLNLPLERKQAMSRLVSILIFGGLVYLLAKLYVFARDFRVDQNKTFFKKAITPINQYVEKKPKIKYD